MTFKVFLEKKTKKQIDGLPKEKARIIETLRELEKGFLARVDIKKLKGTKNHFRIRIGNYRILLVIESNAAYIYDISHRGQVYK